MPSTPETTGAHPAFRGDGRWVADLLDTTSNPGAVNAIWGTSPKNLYVATVPVLYHGTAP